MRGSRQIPGKSVGRRVAVVGGGGGVYGSGGVGGPQRVLNPLNSATILNLNCVISYTSAGW